MSRQEHTDASSCTVCPRSLDPFYIVTYLVYKMVKTSLADSIYFHVVLKLDKLTKLCKNCMPRKSCTIFIVYLQSKNGQHFLDEGIFEGIEYGADILFLTYKVWNSSRHSINTYTGFKVSTQKRNK